MEYGLLWPGFIALGYLNAGSHKLMQLKWGITGDCGYDLFTARVTGG